VAGKLLNCETECLDVPWCGSPDSISRRAPSTTRTSLRFRINGLRATETGVSGNCVRPVNLAQSLMAHPVSRQKPEDSLTRGNGIPRALQ
jgi:hypothetical protein